jgi:hypothetical protein
MHLRFIETALNAGTTLAFPANSRGRCDTTQLISGSTGMSPVRIADEIGAKRYRSR